MTTYQHLIDSRMSQLAKEIRTKEREATLRGIDECKVWCAFREVCRDISKQIDERAAQKHNRDLEEAALMYNDRQYSRHGRLI